jgi:transposase-like protein
MLTLGKNYIIVNTSELLAFLFSWRTHQFRKKYLVKFMADLEARAAKLAENPSVNITRTYELPIPIHEFAELLGIPHFARQKHVEMSRRWVRYLIEHGDSLEGVLILVTMLRSVDLTARFRMTHLCEVLGVSRQGLLKASRSLLSSGILKRIPTSRASENKFGGAWTLNG